MRTLYDVLEVPQDAGYERIRDAYHCRLNACRSARQTTPDDSRRQLAETELKWIHRAWEILSSPKSRLRYDHQLVHLFIQAATDRTRAIPASVFTQTHKPSSFSCANCEYHVDGKTLTKCPRCGQPTKASWVPRHRIIRSLGLVPVAVALADALTRQRRRFKKVVGLAARCLASPAFAVFLVAVVLVAVFIALCVSALDYAKTDGGWPWVP